MPLFGIINKVYKKGGTMKYNIWLNEWLENYIIGVTKKTTYKKYRNIIQNHISFDLGQEEIDKITPNILQNFITSLTKKGLASNTINGIISILRTTLKKAIVVGIIDKEYTDCIKRPKQREKRVESFGIEEQRKIEHYIIEGRKFRLYGVIISLYTGIRLGELLALQWEDIDISKGTISITKTCRDGWENGSYHKIIDTPKTETSQRIIPIPKKLMIYIRKAKKNYGGKYVVGGKTIYGAQIRTYQKSFENCLIKLNIKHKGFHSLRHTFATRALECGMDIKTLSEILGHNNPSITLKRYAHSMLEHKKEMMNKVGKLLE